MSICDCNFAICESITCVLVDDIIYECIVVIMVVVSFLYWNLICGNVLVSGLVIDVRKTRVHVGDNMSQSWKCVYMWFLSEVICSAERIVILMLCCYIAFYQMSWDSHLTFI